MSRPGDLLVWPGELAEELTGKSAGEPGPVLLDVRGRLGGPVATGS